jgi:hypothetical protein
MRLATAAALPPDEPRAEARVPRVGGRPEALGLRHRPQPNSQSVGPADDDRAGLAHPTYRSVVVVGNPVLEGAAAVRGHEPFGLEAEVLHPNRHSRERPRVSGANRVRLGQCALGTEGDERVQLGIEPLDRLEGSLDELACGDVACPHARRLLGRGREDEVRRGAGCDCASRGLVVFAHASRVAQGLR